MNRFKEDRNGDRSSVGCGPSLGGSAKRVQASAVGSKVCSPASVHHQPFNVWDTISLRISYRGVATER